MNKTFVPIGAASVYVRFDFEPEQRGFGAHPDYPPYVTVEEVCIGGQWVSPENFSDAWLMGTEAYILSERGKSLQAEHDEAAWEAQQERLAERGYP
jgi:hypothetical protein